MSSRNSTLAQGQIVDASSALNDYFDVLLQEVTESQPSVEGRRVSEEVNSAAVASAQQECSKFVIEEESSSHTDERSSESAAEKSVVTELVEVCAQSQPECVEAASAEELNDQLDGAEVDEGATESEGDNAEYYVEGAPDWARRPFQALEFSIAKLKLVIPLVHLFGILDWDQAALTSMPGHSKHFIGVWPNHGINSKIVDVAEMMVPQRYQHKIEPWQKRLTKVVLIDDSVWGLACDEIMGVVTLDPREVRWRCDRTHRPWLAGTLIEHMSALVDGDQFAVSLLQGEESVTA
ncbi:chemotaxis protein CheW [Gammaproteobacteria bacterium AH-315-C21]|nr:chemotaxis protein CheW [Gammaproteobacteria bacterium AH-315-C21]